MIWYKLWRESRARFLVAAAIMIVTIGWAILDANGVMRKMELGAYNKYVWHVYASRFQPYWVFSILFLGMGGLVRERALGTADFTLSLPVSRRRWMMLRVLLGVAQSAVLAFVPVVVIPIASRIIGQSYPVWQAVKLSTLALEAGIVIFCLGFFYSCLLQGDFAAPAIGGLTVFLMFTGRNYVYRFLPSFDMPSLLSGFDYINQENWFLEFGWPWIGVLRSLFAGIVLLFAANYIVERRDF